MPPSYLQVLNLNLGQAGSAISVAHDAAVHITPDSTRHGPASLMQPQIPTVTGAGINGGEEDDSATESETESDREEMMQRIHMRFQQTVKADKHLHSGKHTSPGPSHAHYDSTPDDLLPATPKSVRLK